MYIEMSFPGTTEATYGYRKGTTIEEATSFLDSLSCGSWDDTKTVLTCAHGVHTILPEL